MPVATKAEKSLDEFHSIGTPPSYVTSVISLADAGQRRAVMKTEAAGRIYAGFF